MTTKEWRERHPEDVARYNRTYRTKHADAIKAHDEVVRQRLRLDVIQAYGGRCQCCGEDHQEFLTIDHINGGGRKQRASLANTGHSRGWYFYRWLKNQGYPKDEYRLLCYNCNCARGRLGYCPHERARQVTSN